MAVCVDVEREAQRVQGLGEKHSERRGWHRQEHTCVAWYTPSAVSVRLMSASWRVKLFCRARLPAAA